MKPVPAILPLLTGLNGGKFRVIINGARNGPVFAIDCAASVNNGILFFQNGYNFLKCLGFDYISKKNDELPLIRNGKNVDRFFLQRDKKMTKKFDRNVPNKLFVDFIYMQIFYFNFKPGDDNFEPRFIYDPIQKIKKFVNFFLNRARCFLAVFYGKNFVVLIN